MLEHFRELVAALGRRREFTDTYVACRMSALEVLVPQIGKVMPRAWLRGFASRGWIDREYDHDIGKYRCYVADHGRERLRGAA